MYPAHTWRDVAILAGEGVGVGTTIDAEADGFADTDADADADGFADAEAAALVVVFAVFVATVGALLAAWLLLVDDVQPATAKEATKSNRIIIAVIGLNCIRSYKKRRLA